MCTTTPATGTPATPPVDLAQLSLLVARCQCLAFCLSIVMSGSGLPDGPDKEGLCYELASIIEESAQQAGRLVGAL